MASRIERDAAADYRRLHAAYQQSLRYAEDVRRLYHQMQRAICQSLLGLANALADATGNARFKAVAAGGTQLVSQLTRPLPPDWAIVNPATGQATPVSAAASTTGPGMFTYDAPRTLIRFAVNPDRDARSALATAWSVFRYTKPADIVTEHQLSGVPAGSSHDAITLVGAAGAAKAAGDTGAVPQLLAEAGQRNAQYPTYYGAAWLALGRLLLTTDRLQPCGT